jgi:hypothetical protein
MQGFTFDKEGTTLDKYTIKTLTRLVYRKIKIKPPNAIKKWKTKTHGRVLSSAQARLAQNKPDPHLTLPFPQTKTTTYTSATSHIAASLLEYKCAKLTSRVACRLLCGTHDEHILELGGCPCVIKILRPLLRFAGHRSYTFTDVLFAPSPTKRSKASPKHANSESEV